mgnify:CR=1 FL=1
MKKTFLGTGIALTLLSACAPKQSQETLTKSGLNPTNYETIVDGVKPVKLYTLKNAAGMEVCVTNFGGRIVSIMVPDKNGNLKDVVLGFDSIADYQNIPSDFGASIGRYANRIAGGRFPLNGKTVQIEQNEGRNHLHGGSVGFHKRIWAAECLGEQAVRFTLHTPDGDAGYPGALTMHVTYRVEGSRLFLDFEGISTKDTILAPTTHMYFNLGGTESILGTTLQINASRWIPVDGELIPTGELRPAEGPFDFRTPHAIAQNFDHGFVLGRRGHAHHFQLFGDDVEARPLNVSR